MRRNLAYGAVARPVAQGISSVACLAFVAFLAIAFWAGTVWIGQFMIRLSATGL